MHFKLLTVAALTTILVAILSLGIAIKMWEAILQACEFEPGVASCDNLFSSPERLLQKNPKMGIMRQYSILLHAGSTTEEISDKTGLTKSDWTLTGFLFLFRYISKDKYSNDELVCQNGTVNIFWLVQITGPPPKVIPNVIIGGNLLKFA